MDERAGLMQTPANGSSEQKKGKHKKMKSVSHDEQNKGEVNNLQINSFFQTPFLQVFRRVFLPKWVKLFFGNWRKCELF